MTKNHYTLINKPFPINASASFNKNGSSQCLREREHLRGKIPALILLIITGTLLLVYSVQVGCNIGSTWFGEQATFAWHMNNYIVLEAQYAYAFFGLATMALGGLATGMTTPIFFSSAKSRKHRIILVSIFFIAIALSGLGFNTLDFMLGCFYWTNMQYPPPVAVPVLGAVDVWNFYFFFFVVPLWLGGFLVGIASSLRLFYHTNSSLQQKSNILKMPHAIYIYSAESKLAIRKKK